MAEPRKITIRLRPVGAKPAASAATPAAPAAPAPAPVAPAPAPTPAPAAPATPTPVTPAEATPKAVPAASAAPKVMTTIKLKKPEAPATPATKAPDAEAPVQVAKAPDAESPAQAAKRQTSRIELPPEMTQSPMSVAEEKTIKLKPISENAKPAADNPQTAKSKTARIALDSVLGGIQSNVPLSNTTQKTIKLKRAAPAGKSTPAAASSPMTPVSAQGSEDKTIKLKKPGIAIRKPAAVPPASKPDDEPQLESLDDLDTLSPLTPMPAEESKGAKAFTVIGIVAACAALIVTSIVCLILQKHAASPDGSPATGNTLHALPFDRI